MKYGFELEFFLRDLTGAPVLVPDGLPCDECGWLVEVRSEPHEDITKAIHLLKAEQDDVERQVLKKNLTPTYLPLFEIPRDLKVQAARRYGKGILNYRNLYGFETHRNSTKLATASLHISFTAERTFTYQDTKKRDRTFKYPGFVDHAKLITGLDRAFKEEIRVAKRNPGFYEIKSDGRIEYRSLPNDVSLEKVRETLEALK